MYSEKPPHLCLWNIKGCTWVEFSGLTSGMRMGINSGQPRVKFPAQSFRGKDKKQTLSRKRVKRKSKRTTSPLCLWNNKGCTSGIWEGNNFSLSSLILSGKMKEGCEERRSIEHRSERKDLERQISAARDGRGRVVSIVCPAKTIDGLK